MAGGLVVPDANSALRVTFGQVRGVDARDGLFCKPRTTLVGIVRNHTGEGEFGAPQVQLDVIRLYTISGGHPGSPNSRNNLVIELRPGLQAAALRCSRKHPCACSVYDDLDGIHYPAQVSSM